MNLTDTIEQEDEVEEAGETATSTAKLSLRGAINAHCKECIYDEYAKGEGTWRQQTESCTVVSCKLYPVRPISKPRKTTGLPSTEE